MVSFEGGQSSLLLQGVVTYVTPVEAFTSGIKIFDRQKVCLITWSSFLKLLIANFLWVKGHIKPLQ